MFTVESEEDARQIARDNAKPRTPWAVVHSAFEDAEGYWDEWTALPEREIAEWAKSKVLDNEAYDVVVVYKKTQPFEDEIKDGSAIIEKLRDEMTRGHDALGMKP